ncbi:MAG TPA: hydrogenase maturation protease [Vicinamibacterales bacterium]|nr:hydrogenase maturation protease [Vicinamibacterales bacterium]
MAAAPDRTLIVGVGNILLADEGLGVHVVRALLSADAALPSEVDLLDAGTALLSVLSELPRYARVIVVDAIRAGGRPGSVYQLDLRAALQEPKRPPDQYSLHQCELMDALLVASRLELLPGELFLVGAEPATCAPATDLSPALARAAERIVSMLRGMAATGASPDKRHTSCANRCEPLRDYP